MLADDLPGFFVASGADFSTGGDAATGAEAGGGSMGLEALTTGCMKVDVDEMSAGAKMWLKCEHKG